MGALLGDDTVDSQRWRKHGGGNEAGKTRGCLTVAGGNGSTTEPRWQTLLVFSELNNIQFWIEPADSSCCERRVEHKKAWGIIGTCPRLASYSVNLPL
jgi:hypothetical protein